MKFPTITLNLSKESGRLILIVSKVSQNYVANFFFFLNQILLQRKLAVEWNERWRRVRIAARPILNKN